MAKLAGQDSADYGPVAGLESFRAAIAARYQGTVLGASGSPGCVLATCGVTHAVRIALETVLEDGGGEIIYPDPGFVLYEPAIRLSGGVPVPWRLDPARQFALDPDRLSRLITARTRAVIVNSPANPTGAVATPQELAQVARTCEERGVTVISDEIYEHYAYDAPHRSMAEFTGNAIVCSGLSKLFRLAGWRLGWCLAAPHMIGRLTVHHQYSVFRAPTVAQRIAVQALAVNDEITAMACAMRAKRDLMTGLLRQVPGLRFIEPQGAFFVYADVSGYGTDWDVATALLSAGVITVPSTGPGAGFGPAGAGFIRLSYACDTSDIEAGAARIREAVARLGGTPAAQGSL